MFIGNADCYFLYKIFDYIIVFVLFRLVFAYVTVLLQKYKYINILCINCLICINIFEKTKFIESTDNKINIWRIIRQSGFDFFLVFACLKQFSRMFIY